MVTGRQTLSKIEATLSDLRNDEAKLNQQLAGLTDEIGRQRAEEADALRDLARFKLAEDGATIARRLDKASREAVTAIEARNKEIAALAKERKAKAKAIAKAETKIADARVQLDAVEDKIEALIESLSAALAADEAHQASVATAEKVAATATAAEEKAKRAEADRATKGAAYERDPLFIYLWRRRYGAADYRSSGLIRFLDGWVAGIVGYADARANYALLTEIPVRLRAHADRLADEAESADTAVADSEDAVLAKLAGEDLAGQTDDLRAEIAEIEGELRPLGDELTRLDQRASAFAAGEDEGFKKAIAALGRSLAGDDIATLRKQALATPSPEDERFVARIDRARADLAGFERDAGGLREQLATVSHRRSELSDIARDFRRRSWDEGGTTFDAGDIIGGLLTAFVLGRISRGEYWGRVEKSHRSKPSRSRGSGFHVPGSFRTISRIGGGAFRTGRRIGGGGFRTGRKF